MFERARVKRLVTIAVGTSLALRFDQQACPMSHFQVI